MLNLIPRYSQTTADNQIAVPAGLEEFATCNPTLARIYAGRGIDNLDQLDTSIQGLIPAENLFGIDSAVALLDKALDVGKHILIVGDFDCDGATSTALMIRALSSMGKTTGAKVDYIVPDRFKYGYGLTPEIVKLGIEKYSPDIIVTVDNGISSHEGVATAQEHGIQVIITDHHLTTKTPPPAEAVVNPNQLNCNFDSKSLVGAGVAFYVLGRLAKVRRLAGKPSYQISKHIDLVALGTIADVGILDKNNRILVHHGLQAIRSGNCSIGILALLELAGRDYKKVSASDFGFIIAPRINAAGRMDSMDVGIECLLSDDWGGAQKCAYQLDKLNQERRAVETKIRNEADNILANLLGNEDNSQAQLDLGVVNSSLENSSHHSIDNNFDTNNIDTSNTDNSQEVGLVNEVDKKRSIVLYQKNWHQGVIGIVAGRLKESHYRPAIVFAPADTTKIDANDVIKGSARSIPGIHIRDAIETVAEKHPKLISHFGGHAMAAGLTIKRANFDAFAEAFEEAMDGVDKAIFYEQKFTDGQLIGQDFSLLFADALKQANIWGQGFVAPMFDGVFEVLNFKILKDKHLKLSLRYPNVQYPIDAICFNYDTDAWDYRTSQVHILFEMDINEWNGKQNLQLMVKDFSVVEII